MRKNLSGQSLIEVIFAVGAAGIILTAIASTVLTSLGATNQSKNQNLASQYAQEGMDIIRNMRDADYGAFLAKNGTYCLNEGEVDLQATFCIKPNVKEYYREVEFDNDPGCGTGTANGIPYTITKVNVIVSWSDIKCTSPADLYCHNVTLSNCFSDFNRVAAP